MDYHIVCTKCGYENSIGSFRCVKCRSILEVKYNYKSLDAWPRQTKRDIGISRYVNLLPITRIFSLKEGNTPLKRHLDREHNIKIDFKIEIHNPTRTFKDRGSAVEISKAIELNAKKIVCASTGNMGLSIARYSKRFGVGCTIFISRNANKDKINKIFAENAEIRYVNGDFNSALREAEAYAKKSGSFLCGDYHYRKEGQKTIAYELFDKNRYDYVFMPLGNGTLFSGFYKGLVEMKRFKLIKRLPKLIAIQSYGCMPLVNAYIHKKSISYEKPNTVADAIAVGYPTFGMESIRAIKATHGDALYVSDEQIIGAMQALANKNIYAEPGGATGYAGFLAYINKNANAFKKKRVAIIITGNNENYKI